MCGIAGLVGAERPEAASQTVAAMTATLRRRGPDSEGIECWPGAVLGHRRLSILDLSALGHQPMLSEDRQIGLVFNGCIYNFLDLRKELEDQGHVFRSHCDTEVLLRGYQRWGIDDLARRLRGMYAFGVWDNRTQTLALVRDRLGVKPLVYAADDRRIAFASTVTALRAAGAAKEIDPLAVLEFLEFGHVTEARTIFREAKKVAPATILEWKAGAIKERSYWRLPEQDSRSRISFPEAVEETERLLLEAVRLRLQADVPIGALLSGGIDSSLVCWALAKLNANVNTYTVSTPGDEADEGPAAAATAQRLGVPHQTVTLAEDGGDLLEELTDAYGEPFGCSSALAMLRVSRAVKPLATVLLTGDGGDDVFLGYRVHPHLLAAQRLAGILPAFTGPLWSAVRPLAGASSLRRAKHLLDYATGGLGAVTRAHDGLPYYAERKMLGPKLVGRELPQHHIACSAQSARRVSWTCSSTISRPSSWASS